MFLVSVLIYFENSSYHWNTIDDLLLRNQDLSVKYEIGTGTQNTLDYYLDAF